jgi:methionyl-tRNA synthetase
MLKILLAILNNIGGELKMGNKKFYITTPIYYPSDKLHIGHSYTTVAADAIARYKRLRGFDVMFLTGTDEHGQKIQRKAEEKGVTSKEYVDEIVSGIIELWDLMKITNDKFIRTTDDYHVEAVQKIFKKLYDKGDIYKSQYEGWYCTPCESFWTETQLSDEKCPDCGGKVELTKEESYFFKLSKYQDRIIEHIQSNPNFIEPSARQNEMINNFLKPGLEDICVSRTTFNWGIPVTFDDKHVVYVWIDALSNYITALGYNGKNSTDYEKYWPADVHLVGKEIVRFHTIIWPAMLMALDEPLPKQIFGHGWLLLEGGKMSKSKGNVVDPVVLIEKYGLDSIRYFLLREVPFGSDGVFSNEALINRINSDLANDLGNLVSRTTAMVIKYFDGFIPEEKESGDFDEDLEKEVMNCVENVENLLDKFLFSNALTEIWKVISRANKYIDETMPWVLGKDKSKYKRLASVMYNLVETLRIISVLLQPFMPETPVKILAQLGINEGALTKWDNAKKWGLYKENLKISKGKVMFPRIDIKKELEELEKESVKKVEQKEVKEDYIGIEDFQKIKFKVAQIVEVEKVEKAKKLLKIKLKLGNEYRTVVSGISEHYDSGTLINKKVVLIENLKPVKIRGIESQGMILAAEDKNNLGLITIDKDIENGSEVR